MSTEISMRDPQAPAGGLMMNASNMQALMSFADMMAKSSVTVPDHLKGKPADCMAIAMQAMQWGMNPFAVAQKTHIVSGRLGYEAQLVNAVVQQSNAIKGAFSYEFTGDGESLSCRVGAVLRGDSAITWGEWLRCGAVQTKNSPLWKVNPKQQLGYLQVKNWARLYCPGAILGVYTHDELADAAPQAERHMGAVEEVRPALPAYAAADFTKNLPAWAKLVEAGKKTPDALLAMLSTKATFTDEQQAAIKALGAKQQAAAPTAPPAPPVDDFVAEMDAAEAEGAK